MSIGFDRDRNRRQRELTKNKTQKGKYHVRIYLKDVFGFAEYREKATYGLGYKLSLTRNTDNGQIKEAFRALTKDDILQPYISEDDFRSSNEGNSIGNNKYSFDIRYQKNFENAQSVKVEFKFSENLPAGLHGYALVLTNKSTSITSDGERMFDLT